MLFAGRASPFSSIPTLPGEASAVIVSSPGDGYRFRFFAKCLKHSFVGVGTSQSGSTYIRIIVGRQMGICPCELRVGGSSPGWRPFFWHFPVFCYRRVFVYQYKCRIALVLGCLARCFTHEERWKETPGRVEANRCVENILRSILYESCIVDRSGREGRSEELVDIISMPGAAKH